ncbi:MAG: aspartate kinase [Planctomycetes bacterium]|nr:aspartate kinase [Planctomycetota bacterium]
MPMRVMKFGGTSVADPQRIRHAASRVGAARADGERVVMVVSAMGDSTDELIDLARKIAPKPAKRELDALMATGELASSALSAIALEDLGHHACSMNAYQCGIRSDGAFGHARIDTIDRAAIERRIDAGFIPVIAGFQAVSPEGDLTTLGRGGSDTTAVAIAAALDVMRDAGCCEIYTDVDGVHTADPRLVPEAPRLTQITYDEMLELAVVGAGVMHERAVVFAQRYGVPIHVRHSQRFEPGTMIQKETPFMESIAVIGCALKSDLGRVVLKGLPSDPGTQGRLFGAIAEKGILVDDIIQNDSAKNIDLSFTVHHDELPEVKVAVTQVLKALGSGTLEIEIGLAKLSVVGSGMRNHSGVASRLFETLGKADIAIRGIVTSEIKISCLIPLEHGKQAINLVHKAFGLEQGERVTIERQLGRV